MSFLTKIYDITHTGMFKYVFHRQSDKVFVANVSKFTTFIKNVLDSKWTLTSHTFRLVAASQQIRVWGECDQYVVFVVAAKRCIAYRYVPIVRLIHRSLFPAQLSQICWHSFEINLLIAWKKFSNRYRLGNIKTNNYWDATYMNARHTWAE